MVLRYLLAICRFSSSRNSLTFWSYSCEIRFAIENTVVTIPQEEAWIHLPQ